jgi:hypothetical protein
VAAKRDERQLLHGRHGPLRILATGTMTVRHQSAASPGSVLLALGLTSLACACVAVPSVVAAVDDAGDAETAKDVSLQDDASSPGTGDASDARAEDDAGPDAEAGITTEGGDAAPSTDGSTGVVLVHAGSFPYVSAPSQSDALLESTGDLLVAAIYWSESAATVTVADSLGNAWRSASVQNNAQCFGGSEVQIWYAPNVRPGTNIVTVTKSTMSKSPLGAYLLEYAGLPTMNPLVASSGAIAPSAGNAMTAGMLTSLKAGALVVALFNDDNGSGTMLAGSGFQAEGTDTGFYTMVEDGRASSAGDLSPTAQLPVGVADACWAAAAVAFGGQ